MPDNFKRMMELVDEVFDVKNDPGQLQVDNHVIEQLKLIHPATLSEFADENGPAAWILVIPTLSALMQQFLNGDITEQQLVDMTPIGASYDVVYLCSASVLPEYRRKGLAKTMTVNAVKQIMDTHQIKTLFYWPFTTEGDLLGHSIAKELGLPLLAK